MLDALVIAWSFIGCFFWRWFTIKWMEKQPKWQECNHWVRLLSHYYTIAFVCFIVLVFDNASSTFQGLYGYGFANPDRFLTHRANVENMNMSCPNPKNLANLPNPFLLTPLNWTEAQKNEVRFDTHGVMRGLVLGSCPAVVLTQLIGWVHIIRHLMRIKNPITSTGRLQDNELRDKAIQIMFLPVIYSVVAYNNVIRLMNLFTGAADLCRPVEWLLSFEEKKAYTLSLYEANLSMADFYEAIALLHFTSLTVRHIRETFLRSPRGLTDKTLVRSQTNVDDPLMKLNNVMSSLVTSGVMAFCVTCLGTFIRGVNLVMQMAWNHKVVSASDEGSLPAMLSGAGLVASTVAIGNVVNVELAFHHELEAFQPGLKFWSTKVIVSIAFIQEAALGLLGNENLMGERKLSDLQINLLYCSLLCYEVLLVAMLHVWAWPASVNITPEERGVAKADREYWDEKPHHVDARERLLCVE